LRILHVLEAAEGGTRRWLCDVLEGLDPSMFAQDCVVSLRRNARFGEVLEPLRQRGHACWVVNMEREVHPLRDALSLRRIVRIARESGCDVIHGHSAKGGMFARAAGKLLSKPVIYTPHAFSFLQASPKSVCYKLAEKAARPWTTLLHAVSTSEAATALRLGFPAEKIRLVPNGVDAKPLTTRSLSDSRTKKVIGAIGSLRPQKSPETYLEACRLLCERRNDVRFVWGGEGPLLNEMMWQVKDAGLVGRVAFNGHVDDARSLMSSFDVFVQCSRYEGLPYAVLDAMSLAKPIVATAVAGNTDAIEDGRTGLLVPARDGERLALAIEWLLDHPNEAARFGARAQERVAREFSLETQLAGLGRLYREAAAAGGAA
jgi:glycosyltransferase involved in cell wall biosynthesis